MSTTTEKSWRDTIHALLSRDGAVEVTVLSHANKKFNGLNFRARVLDFVDGCVLLERPSAIEVSRTFKVGVTLYVLAVRGDERWAFETSIEQLVKHQFNARTMVVAARLKKPHAVESAQRRDFYRVCTAGAKIEPALLIPITPDDIASQPGGREREVKSFSARLLNVGGGGIGVEAPSDMAKQLSRVKLYRVVLILPDADQPLEIRAKLAHLQRNKNGTFYVGLAFSAPDGATQRRYSKVLSNFATNHQRRQLQRRRQ